MNKILKIVQVFLLTILLMLLTGILFWGLNKNINFSMFGKIKEVKKDIARIKTVLTERKMTENK